MSNQITDELSTYTNKIALTSAAVCQAITITTISWIIHFLYSEKGNYSQNSKNGGKTFILKVRQIWVANNWVFEWNLLDTDKMAIGG